MEEFVYKGDGNLRLIEGFRFKPTDQELVEHYLKHKIQSLPLRYPSPEADVCTSDPWNLPGNNSEQERYFFSMVQTKHPNGIQTDRTAPSGYWRAQGANKKVYDSAKNQVGTKKSLVFYISKPPNGVKTNWVMHEYKVVNPTQGMQNWMICRVFMKKKARNDMVLKSGSRNFDLNGGSSSSSGSSGVTFACEDEENSK